MSAGAACFVQTCDQVITGRQFQYDRSLEIIQDEEYLDDADFNDIKRYDILKKIGEVDTDFNIPESQQYSNWMPIQAQKNYNGKFSKNHYEYTQRKGSQTQQNFKHETEFEPVLTEVYNDESELLSRQKRASCELGDCTCLYFTGPPKCECLFGGPCIVDPNPNTTTVRPPITEPPVFERFRPAAQNVGVFGAGMVGMAMMVPNLNFAGGAPGGTNGVGTIGGGGLPSDGGIATLALSLALVPLGLAAVSIFPPFERPRTIPAIAVIFNEERDMTRTIQRRDVNRIYRMIKKRSPAPFWIGNTKIELPSFSDIKYALKKIQPRSADFLTTAWNSLSSFRVWIAKSMYKRLSRPMKKLVKKIGRIEALMHKKLVCIQPRLKRRYGLLVYPEGLTIKAIKEKKKNIENFIKYGNAEDAHVEYIEDCFEDMERPKFGWRVKVTLMENEPCDISFENPDQTTCILNSNPNDEADDSNYFAQSRQTGEGFRSAATPDCRVEYVCETPPNQAQLSLVQPVPVQPAVVQPVEAQPDTAPDAQVVGIIQDQPQLDQLQPPLAQPAPAQLPPDLQVLGLRDEDQSSPAQEVQIQQVQDTVDFESENQGQIGQSYQVQLQPLPDQPDPFDSAPWQATYVQEKQPSNSVYYDTS